LFNIFILIYCGDKTDFYSYYSPLIQGCSFTNDVVKFGFMYFVLHSNV